MKWLYQILALLLGFAFHNTEATFDVLFNSLNSLFNINSNDGLDTSDGRFERFNGPVRGLPEG